MIKRVMKTLVIGLGTTGTEICNELAERLKWEYRDLENVPWVQFLCFETDANNKPAALPNGTLYALNISKSAFGDYKRKSQLGTGVTEGNWLNLDVLEDLKTDEVVGGARNIRTIGRLALLHNTKVVNEAIQTKSAQLKSASLQLDAESRLRDALGDDDVNVEFADNGVIRVLVVGTLVGGTCSGCISDFGFLLEKQLPGALRIAALTIPVNTLSASSGENYAERFKKNAWHALTELNHYSLGSAEGTFPPFRFPGDSNRVDPGNRPFDEIYLLQPTDATPRGLAVLSNLIADMLHMRVFATEIDPKADFANLVQQPIDGAALRFATLGVSTIEFPAFLVTEACTKYLLAWTLGEWMNTGSSSQILQNLDINWEWLVKTLTTTDSGEDLRTHLNSELDSAIKLAQQGDLDGATRKLEAVRAAASKKAATISPAGLISSGSLHRCCQEQAVKLKDKLLEVVKRRLDDQLMDLKEGGPKSFLHAIRETIKTIKPWETRETPAIDTGKVDACSRQLTRIHESRLLKVLKQTSNASHSLLGKLRTAARNELADRIQATVAQAVREGNEVKPVERMVNFLNGVRGALEVLEKRINVQIGELESRAKTIDEGEPDIAGECLFKPKREGQRGTVEVEYEDCLTAFDDSGARDYTRGRRRAARDILLRWTNLANLVIDSKPDAWIRTEYRSNIGERPIPFDQYKALEREAALPFAQILNEDVVARWSERPDKLGLADALFTKAKPSLNLDPTAVWAVSQSAARVKRWCLLPKSTKDSEFRGAVSHHLARFKDRESMSRHVIAAVQFHLGFPITTAPSIVGPDGIHAAQCNDFKFFYTRQDVDWKIVEHDLNASTELLRQALVVNLLLGTVNLRSDAIVVEYDSEMSGKVTRRLKMHTQQASQQIDQGHDLDGLSTTDLPKQLLSKWQRILSDMPGETREAREEAFVIKLISSYKNSTDVKNTKDYGKFKNLLQLFLKNNLLVNALRRVNEPSEDAQRTLWKNEGDELANGEPAKVVGFYCLSCGTLIGVNTEEASEQMWTCPIHSSHYHGKPL